MPATFNLTLSSLQEQDGQDTLWSGRAMASSNNTITIQLYTYDSEPYNYPFTDTCTVEDACLFVVKELQIHPSNLVIFGLVSDDHLIWWPLNKLLSSLAGLKTYFRCRFRIPTKILTASKFDNVTLYYIFLQCFSDVISGRLTNIYKVFLNKEGRDGLAVLDLLCYCRTKCITTKELTRKRIIKSYHHDTTKEITKALSKLTSMVFKNGTLDCIYQQLQEEEENYSEYSQSELWTRYICSIYERHRHNYCQERYTIFTLNDGKLEEDTIMYPPNRKFPTSHYSIGAINGISSVKVDEHVTKENELWRVHINKTEGHAREIFFTDLSSAESFVSLLEAYYRVTVCHYFSVCVPMQPPSLTRLLKRHCHGHITSQDCTTTTLTLNIIQYSEVTLPAQILHHLLQHYRIWMPIHTDSDNSDNNYQGLHLLQPIVYHTPRRHCETLNIRFSSACELLEPHKSDSYLLRLSTDEDHLSLTLCSQEDSTFHQYKIRWSDDGKVQWVTDNEENGQVYSSVLDMLANLPQYKRISKVVKPSLTESCDLCICREDAILSHSSHVSPIAPPALFSRSEFDADHIIGCGYYTQVHYGRTNTDPEVAIKSLNETKAIPHCGANASLSRFFLFPAIKSDLCGQKFGSNNEVIHAVDDWLDDHSSDLPSGNPSLRTPIGEVCIGDYTQVCYGHTDTGLQVAIKIIRNFSDKHLCVEALQESVNLLREVKSAYMVRLVGVCLVPPFVALLEYCPLGSLLQCMSQTEPPVSFHHLVTATHHLTNALIHLASVNLVHGNIMCRNILVSSLGKDIMVKLADPGMVNLYKNLPLEHVCNQHRLPWLAPELRTDLQCITPATDIYSFGSTVWEMFSYGHIPPHHPEPTDTIPTLLTAADNDYESLLECKTGMSDLIGRCWGHHPGHDPVSRPHPKQLCQLTLELTHLIEREFDDYDAKLTVNLPKKSMPTNPSTVNLYSQFPSGEPHGEPPNIGSLKIQASLNVFGSDDSPLLGACGGRPDRYGDSITDYELKREDVIVDPEAVLGKGNYGKVMKGTLLRRNGVKECAVKELKDDRSKILYNECKIMIKLRHTNIVRVYGVCLHSKEKPMWLVMECMKRGALSTLLWSKDQSLTEIQRVNIASDVASGMEYLASKLVIHRDLAARNVLLTGDLTAKISDFGLAKLLDEKDYYRVTKKNPVIPAAWYPPEFFVDGKSTTAGDIWSYGITVWEMYSPGKDTKLKGVKVCTTTILEALQRGLRLPKPKLCTDNTADFMYSSLMWSCWNADPSKRPSFTAIICQLLEYRKTVDASPFVAGFPDCDQEYNVKDERQEAEQ